MAIPLSAALLVRSSTSRDRLHAVASNAIRQQLGLRATIGRVHLQLVPFSLVAHDITLDDPIYGRMAEADELVIRPSLSALIRGGIDLHTIDIRGAEMRLVIRNGHIRNLPRLDTAGGAGPPTVPFSELNVYDSTLTVDAEPHLSGQLRNVEMHVRGTDDGVAIEADSSDGWLHHEGGRETISRIDGAIEITERELLVPHLLLNTPVADVTVRAGAAPMTFGRHGYRGEVQLRYDLDHIERLPIPDDVTLPPLTGRVELDLALRSEERNQRAEGSVDLRGVAVEQYGLGEHTTLQITVDRERVAILEGSLARLPHDGGVVDLEGTISLDPDTGFAVDVEAHPNEMRFGALMNNLGVTENGITDWVFVGTLGLSGTLDPVRLAGPVNVDTHDFVVSHNPYFETPTRRVISVSRAAFTGRWSIDERAVRFDDLVGELPRSRVRGNVHLGFDNQFRVHASSDQLDLRDITPLDRWPLQGVGTARVDIDSTFQDPVVTGHVQLADFVFDNFALGDIESDALLDPDGLGVRFAMVNATKNESHYRAEDLYLNFHDDRFEMTGLLHLDGLELSDFYAVFGFEDDERYTPYQALARGQANIHYTNGFPDDAPSGTLDVDMNLSFDRASLNDYEFEDGHLSGRWRWLDWDRGAAGGELSIAHLSLRKGEGTVTLDGRMELGGVLSMNAVADRIALSQLEGVGDRFDGIGGVATAVGRIGGTFDLMRADFDVGVTNVTYDGGALGDGRFYVRLTDRDDPYVAEARRWNRRDLPDEPCARARDGLAHSDWPADPPVRTRDGPVERLSRPMAFLVCGSGLDDRLFVDAAIGRTATLPMRGVIRLDALDVGPMLPRLPDGSQLAGGVTGTVDVRAGSLSEPETLAGTVNLSELFVAQGELAVRNFRPVELAFANGGVTIGRARFVGPDSRVRVRGNASLRDGLALQVNGDVDLGLAARLTRTVDEASGRMRGRFDITGSLDDPRLHGSATVSDGAFRFASFEPTIDQVEGQIRFSERSVSFDNFRAQAAGGQIQASGRAEIRGTELDNYEFDLNADGFNFEFREGVDAGFGARTRLRWARGDRVPTLSGRLIVDRFRYGRAIELQSLGDVAASAVQGMLRQERTEVRRYDPEQDLVALDLRIRQRAPFIVDNNLIQARVRIQEQDRPFRIVGTDQRFGVLGTMEISNGNPLVPETTSFECAAASCSSTTPPRSIRT